MEGGREVGGSGRVSWVGKARVWEKSWRQKRGEGEGQEKGSSTQWW